MTKRQGWSGPVARRLALLIIALAGRLVPGGRRDAWREEWESEVWHQVHGSEPGTSARAIPLVMRSIGAVPHAMWIWAEEWNMDSLVQDIRFAFRTLRKRPGFTLVAVTTLALGIGGNAAVFSVVNAVLLRPLPLEDADELVWVWGREFNGQPAAAVSAPDYAAFDGEPNSFEALAAFTAFSDRMVYRGGDRPIELTARGVSHDFLTVLGATPALGRGFTQEETEGENSEVVMLSHGLWGRMFGFDPGVLGSTVVLGAESYTVVGVLPEGLDTPIDVDAWIPLTFGAEWYGTRSAHFLRPIGRLGEGATTADAQASLNAVAARLEAEYPETNTDWYPIVQDLQSIYVGPVRPALMVLVAAIGLVLLIACANVGSLLLARSVGRTGEIAVRGAMGAPRGRIVRQLITESMILSTLAGAIGVVVAWAGVATLVRLQPGNLPRVEEISVDASMLVFTLGLSAVVGVLFGLVPALGAARTDVATGLRANARGSIGGYARLRSVFVGGEVAASFVLLVGAVLLVRSFSELRAVDPGFDPEGVVALTLLFPDVESDEELVAVADRITDRVGSTPGVLTAGRATVLPFGAGGGDTYVYAEGRPPAQIRNIENTAFIRTVDEAYFETMRVPLEQGRPFEVLDDIGAPKRVIINEALAARLFPGEDPVGQRLVVELQSSTAMEIIGVARDVRQFAMNTPAMPEFFLSARQYPVRGLQLLVRGGTAPPTMDDLRAAVWEVDPSQPLTRVSDLDELVARSLAPGRFQALLMSVFSVLAVVLAGIGIYGVLAESVNGRRREIGVRMAMGADPRQVVGEVVGKGVRVALIGLAVGAAGAYAGSQLLESLLFGVNPRDPMTFALAPVFLLGVVLLASWLPASQAARIDPVSALRQDA